MSRKVAFEPNTPRLDGSTRYDTDSVVSDSMSVKLSRDRDLPTIMLEEMDGDGVVDLVVGAGDDEVCVHRGATEARGRRFSGRALTCFAADPFGRFIVDDLDLDGRRDVIHYSPEGPDRGKVFVSFTGL